VSVPSPYVWLHRYPPVRYPHFLCIYPIIQRCNTFNSEALVAPPGWFTQTLFEFTSFPICNHQRFTPSQFLLTPVQFQFFSFLPSNLPTRQSKLTMPGVVTIASVAAFAALTSYIAPSIRHELKVLGVGRDVSISTIADAANYVKIADTTHCEDLHYYAPANLLFTACEDRHTRFGWFPPLGSFEPPKEGTKGSIHVVDPEVSLFFPYLRTPCWN